MPQIRMKSIDQSSHKPLSECIEEFMRRCRLKNLSARTHEYYNEMAGVFSELELSMIRAKERSGMANARAKGKQIGRKPVTKADFPAIYCQVPSFIYERHNDCDRACACM